MRATPSSNLPPEWARQSGVMLTWPHREMYWAEIQHEIDRVYVEVAKAVAPREKLLITCLDEDHQQHIKKLLKKAGVGLANVDIHKVRAEDIWVRDHGPICVNHADQPAIMDFTFNGWGNKYPAELDDKITRSLYALKAFDDIALHTVNMVLEGGSIESDGRGTLMTTTSCLFAKTRNPALSRTQITSNLQEKLGVKKILFLEHGYLAGDDTDGHIDTLARFVNPHTICYVRCPDPADEHFAALTAMEKQLQSFTDYQGGPYQLVPLPWPKAQYAYHDGRRLPATYANFLIINDAVLVPTYDDPADAGALNIFSSLFPEREIIGINAVPVIQWFGSIHCMTMQLPEGVLK